MKKISFEAVSPEFLRVNSCGRQLLGKQDYHCSRPYGRIDYHLLYLRCGRCHIKTAERELVIEAGDLAFFYPGEMQDYRFLGKDRTVSCYVHFTGSGCERLLERLFPKGRRFYHIGLDQALDEVFNRLLFEYYSKKKQYETVCAACLMAFLALAARYCENRSAQGTGDLLMEESCKWMQLNYQQKISICEAAAQCGLSVSRYAHRFKQAFGITPIQYLHTIRIEQAKEMLRSTDCGIAEVAELVGWPDANYFSRIFKKYTGLSPYHFAKATIEK